VVNFVQNALKYSPPDSTLRVRLDRRGDQAAISVIDAGPGIAAGDESFVFDKYRRTASARGKEGLGLGLYISRKIIEAHGGEIGLESTPGKGATFFVRLPRIAAVAAAAPPLAQPRPAAPSRLKVLLVDDEVNAVSALTMLLGEEGLDVQGATSGEEALAAATTARPDVVVLDVQLPGMSGLTLLTRLRELHPALPAIIMSGHMEHHEGIAGAREGSGAAYVSKPIDVDELVRTIARVTQ
jgi:two-component system CheB/CheR fusion protein